MFSSTLLHLLILAIGAAAANVCGTLGVHDPDKISYYMGNFFLRRPIDVCFMCLVLQKRCIEMPEFLLLVLV
jgi:hypothetical protein